MKRMQLFWGVLGWTIICVIWGLTFGSQVLDDRWGNSHRIISLSSMFGFKFIIGLLVWYLICWINFINEWERRPYLRFGRYAGTAGPGPVLIEPIFNKILADVPVQDVVEEVPVEHVQTKDNVGVSLVGLLTYRINQEKVKDAVVEVEDITDAIQQRGLSALTDVVGTVDLDHLLENRGNFCEEIKKVLSTRIGEWGVTVKAFELKSFKITDSEVENAIAMKAKAKKEGEAELTRAHMQKQIAEALNEAAETYDDEGRWLKGMETLVELCRSAQNNTVLIPTDLTGSLANAFSKIKTP
jgi:regulator of protease activity HflC (stomatin/prohibitin superfamily)